MWAGCGVATLRRRMTGLEAIKWREERGGEARAGEKWDKSPRDANGKAPRQKRNLRGGLPSETVLWCYENDINYRVIPGRGVDKEQ